MASQDNPEQGLCHNSSVPRPVPEVNRRSKSKGSLVDLRSTLVQPQDSGTRRRSTETEQKVEEDLADAKVSGRKDKHSRRKMSIGDAISRRAWPDLTSLEEPTPTDHRSFVQNVFGTVAFKMLEWLTPRNLDLLARSEDKTAIVEEELPVEVASTDTAKDISTRMEKSKNMTVKEAVQVQDVPMDDLAKTEMSAELREHTSNAPETSIEPLNEEKAHHFSSSEIPATASSVPPTPTNPISDSRAEQKRTPRRSNQSSHAKRPSNLRTKSDPLEPVQKSIVNKMASEPMADVNTALSSHGTPMPRRKMSKTLITSPKMQMADTNPALHELKFLPPARIIESESPSLKDDESEASQNVHATRNKPQSVLKETRLAEPALEKQVSLPQSLSYLSIEVIELLCDILQFDGTSEKHFLHPEGLDETLKRRRSESLPLFRDMSSQNSAPYRSTLKQQWRYFIEQSLFDVLSRPESLLRSFSDDEDKLYDTQTTWYLMLRMTRVAPSLVFDSLWNLAGTLFKPPQKLEAAYEWAKEFQSQEVSSQKALSNHEAAQAINICLHALVAAAPLVSDARQLANMSRIRSYGLAMLGREASSLEPAILCLQYEDAFTNDLAVRLARRLFAAISTRRRFTELLNLQADIRKDEKPQTDVLETVLGTLKFLDLDTPPIINFSDDERDIHEKRVPTLILDWARTVMLQEWAGAAEVPSDGPFGGALATMAAICKLIIPIQERH
jgi:hypothetical protein